MAQSLSFYLTTFVIKAKGFKKIFSHSPIEYKKLRKGDIYNPKGKFFDVYAKNRFQILSTTVTEIATSQASEQLILFFHGGAFVSGPSAHHWDSAKKIVQETNASLWMCNYPKAPENKIDVISRNIDAVYSSALETYKAQNIVLIGDSAGGNLAITLVQRLITENKPIPSKLVLISPIMDASFDNPAVDLIEKKDVMLSKAGVVSAKRMCLENDELKNPIISPLFGSFKGFPTTYVCLAENDISYPDQVLFCERLKDEKVEHTAIVGEKMPHIWPLLPVMKEAKTALHAIIHFLQKK